MHACRRSLRGEVTKPTQATQQQQTRDEYHLYSLVYLEMGPEWPFPEHDGALPRFNAPRPSGLLKLHPAGPGGGARNSEPPGRPPQRVYVCPSGKSAATKAGLKGRSSFLSPRSLGGGHGGVGGQMWSTRT